MRLVVADTGPLNYLVLIDLIELLPRLFDQVAIPNAVCEELSSPDTPSRVVEWIGAPPS